MKKLRDQEVFDLAVKNIIIQGKPAIDRDINRCYFFGDKNLHCAAYFILKELGFSDVELKDADQEYGAIYDFLNHYPEIEEYVNIQLINAIQACHDKAALMPEEEFVNYFTFGMEIIAKSFRLHSMMVKHAMIERERQH